MGKIYLKRSLPRVSTKKGVNLAKGDFIFVLHSDSVLEPGWSEIVKKYFNKDAGYYCKLSFDIIHPLASMTSTWANARSLIFNLLMVTRIVNT